MKNDEEMVIIQNKDSWELEELNFKSAGFEAIKGRYWYQEGNK